MKENKIEKFTGDWKKKLPEEEGREIIKNANLIGKSDPVKDCYWSIWQLDDQYYISLNDGMYSVWRVSKEDAELYNDNPLS